MCHVPTQSAAVARSFVHSSHVIITATGFDLSVLGA
jgi:hypothetical protein